MLLAVCMQVPDAAMPCGWRICGLQDPKATKPDDWDEREKIPDPKDKKPKGWDDIPATIVDPDAKKPGGWSTEGRLL